MFVFFLMAFYGRHVADSSRRVTKYIVITTKLVFDLQLTKEYAWP